MKANNNRVIGVVGLLLSCLSPIRAQAATDSSRMAQVYDQAYQNIAAMLQSGSGDFELAVYYTENAYLDDTLSYRWFDGEVQKLATLSRAYLKNNTLLYAYPDSATVASDAGVFRVMTTKIPIAYGDSIFYHQPYTYNFSDYDGSRAWPDMFVSTLLKTHQGNCHSMPYLYKMVAHELGAETFLALAPNHVYIKLCNQKDGWYNTELTSGDFPLDAWVMASGYVHLDAIRNAVYMDTLGTAKCMAMCLVDLAQGYEQKASDGNVDAFILQCCNTALQYFPDYINALLLQQKVYERQFARMQAANNLASPQALITASTEAKQLYERMNVLAGHLHDLGYRRMPAKMYLEWLAVLKTQNGKYSNKKITTFTH